MLESLINYSVMMAAFLTLNKNRKLIIMGFEVTAGLNQSDIHGTLLITWAIILILDILTNGDHKYKIIKLLN